MTATAPRRRVELTNEELAAAKNLRAALAAYTDRDGNRLAQSRLAQMLGMTQPAVNQYLNGVVALNVKSTLRFAEALNVDPVVIYPELEPYFRLAKHSSRVKVEATLTKDGRLVRPHFEKELEWTAPVPNARAILMERDLGPSCPKGTMIIYDADVRLTTFHVLANPAMTYVVAGLRGKRYDLYPCNAKLGEHILRFIGDAEAIVDLDTADATGALPNGVLIHPVIGKMCLSGTAVI